MSRVPDMSLTRKSCGQYGHSGYPVAGETAQKEHDMHNVAFYYEGAPRLLGGGVNTLILLAALVALLAMVPVAQAARRRRRITD